MPSLGSRTGGHWGTLRPWDIGIYMQATCYNSCTWKEAFIHDFLSSYSKPTVPTSESQRQVSMSYSLVRYELHMHDPCICISRKFKGCGLMIAYAHVIHYVTTWFKNFLP